jgi:hypothetical protein
MLTRGLFCCLVLGANVSLIWVRLGLAVKVICNGHHEARQIWVCRNVARRNKWCRYIEMQSFYIVIFQSIYESFINVQYSKQQDNHKEFSRERIQHIII